MTACKPNVGHQISDLDGESMVLGHPGHILNPGSMVGSAAHGEEEVAQAIDPFDGLVGDWFGVTEVHHQPFGPSTHGSRQVESSGDLGSTRKHEAADLGGGCGIPVDLSLDGHHVVVRESSDAIAVPRPLGGRKIGPEVEAAGLELREIGAGIVPEVAFTIDGGCNQPEAGIQFIHRSIRLDPGMILAHPVSGEEPGLSIVTTTRVKLHRIDP